MQEASSDQEHKEGSPRVEEFHFRLRDAFYGLASEYKITGFEAGGCLTYLLAEITSSALVRRGLLQGGSEFEGDGDG